MITDNQNELFDIVDENDQVIGQARRGEVHGNKSLIHRSIGVIILNEKGEAFLQQRSSTKDTDPLKWTISVSGHVDSGKTYEKTAVRELEEELGIDVPFVPFVKFLYRGDQETEISQLYKAVSNGPFFINKEEIIEGNFFTQEELQSRIKLGKIELSKMGKEALRHFGWRMD